MHLFFNGTIDLVQKTRQSKMAVQENLKWGAKEYDCLNVNELKVGDLVVVPYDGGKEFYLGAIQHVKKDIEVVNKIVLSS